MAASPVPAVHPLTPARRPSPQAALTARVKLLAAGHGLAIARVTTADAFPELEPLLLAHIAAGRVRGMDWFTAERARFSADPRNLHPAARSIVAVGVAYHGPAPAVPDDGVPRGRIARYAWGIDYHDLLKRRLRALRADLERLVERPVEARFLVDTARIVDRAVAARAGLGWDG